MQTTLSHEEVARLHAEANPSDPFAYCRIKLHLDRGIEDPQKVVEESLRQINVRTMARRAKEQKDG